MGVLRNMFGTAAQAGQTSLGFGAASAGLDAAGQLFGGLGRAQQYMYGAAVASRNAAIEEQNAQSATEAGGYAEARSRLQYGQLIGEQKAAQAASGLDVAGGSAQHVRESTQLVGDMDAAMIRYNASREAYGSRVQEANMRAQAGADRLAAVGVAGEGLFRAGGSLLGSASALGEKWAQFKLLGVTPSVVGGST